ncbi:ABC transporter permease [Phytomonospora sp. NPDC050363]|uniref:ABC transporter permease n=1 Tax=Phytomonospora sp. NPDC050363 TaxID=3155642 RepID=UPI0033D05783
MSGTMEPIAEADLTVVEEISEAEAKKFVGRSPGQLAWARLKRDRTAKATFITIVLLMVAAYGAPLWSLIYGSDAYKQNPELLDSGAKPLGFAGMDGTHWLGVLPGNGEDVLMQLLYGIRTSVSIAIITAIVVVALGAIVGAFSAFVGGWLDAVINWFIDVMLSLPFLIIALAAVPIVTDLLLGGPGERPLWVSASMIMIVLLIFSWMGAARLVRGQVMSLREREFIEAARAAGAGPAHIVFKQILPNVWAPILVSFSMTVPALVAAEAYLAFLGVGVSQPHPDLGRLVAYAVGQMRIINGWFLLLISGGTIFLLVLTFNLFGDSVRDALNPKSNR